MAAMSLVLEITHGIFVTALVLFASFWGFHYGTPNSDTCWTVKPFYGNEYIRVKDGHAYHGLPGSGRHVAAEEDDLFVAQYVLYALAVACSAIGLILALRLWMHKHERENYGGGGFRSYARGLCFYFFAALVVNFLTSMAFTEYRCHYHNISHKDNERVATDMAEWAKASFMVGNFWGGFFRNLVMEFVLLFKASMMQSDTGSNCLMRTLKWVILAQIAFFVLFLPVQIYMWKHLMESGFEGVFGEDWTLVYVGRAAAAAFGVIHVVSSVALVYVFVRPLLWQDELSKDKEKTKSSVVKRVIVLASIAVTTTFLTYVNIGLGLVNSYLTLVLDSIANDVCMILVSFAAPEEEKQLSQEAAHGTAVNPIAIGQKSESAEPPQFHV